MILWITIFYNSFINFDDVVLDTILNAVDGSNRTPLALAYEMNAKGEDEILSLRRWDVVADGPANFQKCIDIIENLNIL